MIAYRQLVTLTVGSISTIVSHYTYYGGINYYISINMGFCDVVGFRELNAEIGLKQSEPTIIYQDNQFPGSFLIIHV